MARRASAKRCVYAAERRSASCDSRAAARSAGDRDGVSVGPASHSSVEGASQAPVCRNSRIRRSHAERALSHSSGPRSSSSGGSGSQPERNPAIQCAAGALMFNTSDFEIESSRWISGHQTDIRPINVCAFPTRKSLCPRHSLVITHLCSSTPSGSGLLSKRRFIERSRLGIHSGIHHLATARLSVVARRSAGRRSGQRK